MTRRAPLEVILALDQGSSSSRALAVDARGRIVARAQFPVKTRFPRPGFVEHDASDLAVTAERALDSVLDALPRRAQVLGLGLAAQRSTVVLFDPRTGKAAAPVPSWQDARGAAVAAALEAHRAAVHEKTGLYLTPYYSAPKVRFLLDSRRLSGERVRAAPVSSFLLWRLSKGKIFSTDPTLAQRMLLYNIRSGGWDEDLLALFGIPRASLPELAPSAGDLGTIERKGRRIPVLASLGDQQAAAYGQGAVPGVGVLNYGTGAFFLLNTGAQARTVAGLLTSVAWQRAGAPCEYFLEGTVHAAGTSLEWLRRNLGLLKDPREADRLCRKSTHRIWTLQAIGGLGAPRWDYQTPTVLLGLTGNSRPEDLVRGVVEAVAFLIADIVSAIRGEGNPIASIRVSGGLARLDYLLEFQAGLLGLPLGRLAEKEATALGVARLAAEAAGLRWKGDPSGAGARVFRPKMPPEKAASLLLAWKAFVETEQKLSSVLRRMGAL